MKEFTRHIHLRAWGWILSMGMAFTLSASASEGTERAVPLEIPRQVDIVFQRVAGEQAEQEQREQRARRFHHEFHHRPPHFFRHPHRHTMRHRAIPPHRAFRHHGLPPRQFLPPDRRFDPSDQRFLYRRPPHSHFRHPHHRHRDPFLHPRDYRHLRPRDFGTPQHRIHPDPRGFPRHPDRDLRHRMAPRSYRELDRPFYPPPQVEPRER